MFIAGRSRTIGPAPGATVIAAATTLAGRSITCASYFAGTFATSFATFGIAFVLTLAGTPTSTAASPSPFAFALFAGRGGAFRVRREIAFDDFAREWRLYFL
jgi:hypothetical protein